MTEVDDLILDFDFEEEDISGIPAPSPEDLKAIDEMQKPKKEEVLPAGVKKTVSETIKEIAAKKKEGKAPAKKAVKAKPSFKETITAKVANGTILNLKRATIEDIELDQLAPKIELIQNSKLEVSVEYKDQNLILVGEQAGLAAVYILLNEN